jgi:uncharacterized protein (UPF0335 family)
MKKGTVSSTGYETSIDPFYTIITIRVKDNASRIEIDPLTSMYSQTADGVEYGLINLNN